MSQSGLVIVSSGGGGGGGTDTFNTDSGTATQSGNAIAIVGGTGIETSGSGATVTITFDGSAVPTIPTSFVSDSGTAIPALNILNVLGGTGIDTSGASNNLTVTFDVTEVPTIPTSVATDSGTATPALNVLTMTATAGTGISVSGASSTVTLAGINATTAIKGVASFDPADFDVTAGVVSLLNPVSVATITGDTGGPISPSGGNWNLFGGPGVTVTGSGSTLTVSSVVFSDQGTSTTMTRDHGYWATGAVTLTLPASPADGEVVMVGCTSASAVVVTANTGQTIRLGSVVSSTAGTATSTAIGDSLTLRYFASGTLWFAFSSTGNWTIV